MSNYSNEGINESAPKPLECNEVATKKAESANPHLWPSLAPVFTPSSTPALKTIIRFEPGLENLTEGE